MIANIITIGDEILIGQIVDSNAAWIANELTQIGISINRIESVSDNEGKILNALDSALNEADLIILTGGLGPTPDDKTKDALAKYFDSTLIPHEETLKKIEKILKSRGIPANTINKQQADMPDNCIILKNKVGSVPGMLFEKNTRLIVSVPGVPYEMKYIFEHELIPYIKNNRELPQIIHKTFMTVGVAESILAVRLEQFEKNLPENYSLAYLPSPGKVRLRLTAKAAADENLSLGFGEVSSQLKLLLDRDLYGFDDEPIESVAVKLLTENNLTLSSAESCTGGNIADAITSIPGASDCFKGAIVAYSNEVKERVLNVSVGDIKKHGAVSKTVVLQMAENVRKILNTDIGIATSGIAGPTGGTAEKPVGTVWIGLSSQRATLAFQFNFGDDRGRTVSRTTLTALNLVRLEVGKLKSI